MGLGDFLKKTAIGTAKVAGSALLGVTGIASSIIEGMGGATGIDFVEEIGHGLKSASFNGVRNIWGAESIEYDHSAGDAGRRKAEEINNQREKLLLQAEREIDKAEASGTVSGERIAEQRAKLEVGKSKIRRTDEELSKDTTGTDRPARSFEHDNRVPLSVAVHQASNSPGVYILWLNESVMKCGRAAYKDGVHWRFTQYYNLKYDDRARSGDYWSVSPENRDDIVVSWQCCPVSKCKELEYKLFQKYGKGPWAHRGPASCTDDSWELLI